ncbi:hypothetical protein [Melittangium boletus]|nr:hypothetical protein [Melittangium boletus]
MERALHVLAALQEPGGARRGPLRMYAPRPFTIDYPMQVGGSKRKPRLA